MQDRLKATATPLHTSVADRALIPCNTSIRQLITWKTAKFFHSMSLADWAISFPSQYTMYTWDSCAGPYTRQTNSGHALKSYLLIVHVNITFIGTPGLSNSFLFRNRYLIAKFPRNNGWVHQAVGASLCRGVQFPHGLAYYRARPLYLQLAS
jgi:hypothetical protein